MRVIGLGFKAEADGRSVSPDSMFIVQELCAGGALRDVVAEQMCSPRQVCCHGVTHGQGRARVHCVASLVPSNAAWLCHSRDVDEGT